MFWSLWFFVFLFFCHHIDYLCVLCNCGRACLCTWPSFCFFMCVCVHDTCPSVHLCVWLCVYMYCRTTYMPPPPPPPPESQEVSVDSETGLGGVAIPEISVTGVSGERMPNGDSLRPRPDGRAQPDGDMLGAASEVSLDPRGHDSGTRGQEVRRQKSVRRMVENEGSGSASTGRSQY